ncbi:hypothetical protein RB598_003022 [Gaeumannomyces tritici]
MLDKMAQASLPRRTLELPKVESEIHFLQRSNLFGTEKPYAFRYHVDAPEVQQTNMTMSPALVTIRNIRGFEHHFSLESTGFEVIDVGETIPYESFFDGAAVELYLRGLERLLKSRLGALHVEVFRYGIRKRHPEFPVSTGSKYEYDQPTSVAHIDTTVDEMLDYVERFPLEKRELFQGRRCQWLNVWKPLRGPLHDWPLTFCDAADIEPDVDLASADLLYPDLATENYQVYHRDTYDWYYLDGQTASEAIVFLQADSKDGAIAGVPHCSFYNPAAPPDEKPRESIETRLLVCYET